MMLDTLTHPLTELTPKTVASRAAAANDAANRQALESSQPKLISLLDQTSFRCTWLYARDASLSAKLGGRWVSGCSVPRKLAEHLLCNLRFEETTSCFLSPSHPAQLEVALERLGTGQAIIAILPGPLDLPFFLHATDFSQPIEAGRLFFAAGENWAEYLRDVLESNPGLPTPQRFIRTPLIADAQSDSLMAQAQRIFQSQAQVRLGMIRSLPRTPSNRVCVVAPSRFRLWDDAATVLAKVLAASDVQVLDTDRPTSSSHFALAQAAAQSRAVVAANLTRQQLPAGLIDHCPLISWVTYPPIPPYNPKFAQDGLLLAGPELLSLAQAAHWPRTRLQLASWPAVGNRPPDSTALIAMICDTTDPSANHRTFDHSSHRLLWEGILEELHSNPFQVLPDPLQYLLSRMRQLEVPPGTLDQRLFLNELIFPAFQQAVVRMLLASRVPLSIHGQGWQALTEFAPTAAGPVASREQLLDIAANARALLHAWPTRMIHPIEFLGRPVLRANSTLLSDARQMLSRPPAPAKTPMPAISADRIFSMIRARGGI